MYFEITWGRMITCCLDTENNYKVKDLQQMFDKSDQWKLKLDFFGQDIQAIVKIRKCDSKNCMINMRMGASYFGIIQMLTFFQSKYSFITKNQLLTVLFQQLCKFRIFSATLWVDRGRRVVERVFEKQSILNACRNIQDTKSIRQE